MSLRIFQILQGAATAAVSTQQLLTAGLTGTRGALRKLSHPDTINFPPLTYFRNPDRLLNYGNEVLRHPITDVERTLSSSKTVRFEQVDEDVVITETWNAQGGVSLPLGFFNSLYELLVNPPVFSATAQTFIQWEPRDRSTEKWNVEFLEMQLGTQRFAFDTRYLIAEGGPTDPGNPGTINTPTDTVESVASALFDQPLSLRFRLISLV